MNVGLSLLPCLTSPLRVTHVLDPQHIQLAANSQNSFIFLPSRHSTKSKTVLFCSLKLSCYHEHMFDILLINGYLTIIITVGMRVTEKWQEGGGGAARWWQVWTLHETALIWWVSLMSQTHPNSCFHRKDRLHLNRSNLRPLADNQRCASCDMSTALMLEHWDWNHSNTLIVKFIFDSCYQYGRISLSNFFICLFIF